MQYLEHLEFHAYVFWSIKLSQAHWILMDRLMRDKDLVTIYDLCQRNRLVLLPACNRFCTFDEDDEVIMFAFEVAYCF